MHLYDESTSRSKIWRVQINWSRELAFSERQRNFIRNTVPNARGVYCIYAKCHAFAYHSNESRKKKWSPVVYIGSGWLNERLYAHLSQRKNELLNQYIEKHNLAFRYDRIVDDDPQLDWPRAVEASILSIFKREFGDRPPANRRDEPDQELRLDKFLLSQSDNFDFRSRG